MHNARNRRAAAPPKRPAKGHSAMGGQVPSFLLRSAEPQPPPLRSFPADVLIPPHRGALARSVDLAPAPVIEMTAPAKPKRKAKPKRAPKPKVAKRHKAARTSAPPPPVIALPPTPEPLVALEAAPPAAPLAPLPRMPLTPPPRGPLRPLPRRRTLAPWRPGGLTALIGLWLRERSRQLAALLAPKRQDKAPVEAELAHLRAENDRLRLQIEALLALKSVEPAASG